MKAAIYARKSTDDDRSGKNKSVTRQVDNARTYARRKGWTIDEDHVYVDDGISGAEFKNRPALVVKGKAPDRVVAEIEAREARIKALEVEIAGAAAGTTDDLTRPALNGH